MNRIFFRSVAACAVLAVAALTSAQTAAPVTPEALAKMKARLAEIKAEAAALEAQIAAAEAPAAGTEPALLTTLNTMPKNLWPGESDSEMKTSLRDKWLADNIKPGVACTFTGKVVVASSSTIFTPGKPDVEGVRVILNCGKHVVWGKEAELRVIVVLENVSPQDTLDWGENKTLTVTGNSKECRPNGNPVEITLETSKAK